LDISSSTSPEDSIKLLDGAAAEFWDLVRFLSSRICRMVRESTGEEGIPDDGPGRGPALREGDD